MKAMQAAELRYVAGHFATGVAVITTRDKRGDLYGLTMNAVTSLSLEPPLFLICVDNTSETLPALLESRLFAINILAKDQEAISRVFASKGEDKFEGLGYHIGETGVPLLEGTLAALECRIAEKYSGGDHVILLGEVLSIQTSEEVEKPLLFYRGGYTELRS